MFGKMQQKKKGPGAGTPSLEALEKKKIYFTAHLLLYLQ